MTVFVRNGCAFSAAVLAQLEALGLTVTKKYLEDPGVADELLARGGRLQVPFLVDERHDAELYDSNLIMHYLDEHYGSEASR